MIIKKTIPLLNKRDIIDEIVSNCITVEKNGLKKVDYFFKELLTFVEIISHYTDIDNSKLYMKNTDENNLEYYVVNIEESVKLYDEMVESGEYNKVLEQIDNIIDNINKEIEQEINLSNSVESILTNFFTLVSNKLPSVEDYEKIVQGSANELNSMDKKKLAIVNKIKDFDKKK